MVDKEQPSQGIEERDSISLNRRSVLGAAGTVAAGGMLSGVSSAASADNEAGFDPVEATAPEIREGYRQGAFTVQEVVEAYLDRIAAYEEELQAVITINPHALERAAELDDALKSDSPGPSNGKGRGPPQSKGQGPSNGNGRGPPQSKGQGPSNGNGRGPPSSNELVGPLHGIPVLIKDNVNTDDIPTTTGTVAMEESVPTESATIVENIREAGGIVIAKANMDEFAFGYTSSSSMGGVVHNPYDLDRTAGGSSGGSGAGIAANYAPIGIGTDTGGSVRVPSLANNMVGLRPTRQLVSGDGVSPLHSSQDVPGPMTKTVADAAILADVLAAPDPSDPLTLEAYDRTPHAEGERYTDYLDEDGLEGARIGVYSEWMPDEDDEVEDVAELFEGALADMESAGATIITELEPPSDEFVGESYRGGHTHKDWNHYLEDIEEFDDLRELLSTGELEHCGMAGTLSDPDDIEELEETLGFVQPYHEQRQLQQYVLRQMHAHDLDAIMYPGNWDVPELDDYSSWGPAHLHLSPVLDWPAMVMPVGFTDEGAPVGMEFLGRKWSEPKLFELTYAYEQISDNRRPPENFGPVEATGTSWDAEMIEKWNEERPVYDTVGSCDLPSPGPTISMARAGTTKKDADAKGGSEIDMRNLPGGKKPQR